MICHFLKGRIVLIDEGTGEKAFLTGASRFCKSMTQGNNIPRVLASLKKAKVQNWDAPFLTGIFYNFFCWLQNNMEVFGEHKANRGFVWR